MITNDRHATVSHHQILTALSELPKGAIEVQTLNQPPPTSASAETPDAANRQRETGDQVNGFMLCALVSQSAKRIKGRAERVGVSLPMSIITRSVLNAYLAAAKDHQGPFANASPDLVMIRKLNEGVLQEVLARHAREKLNHRVPPAQASRYGDDRRM